MRAISAGSSKQVGAAVAGGCASAQAAGESAGAGDRSLRDRHCGAADCLEPRLQCVHLPRLELTLEPYEMGLQAAQRNLPLLVADHDVVNRYVGRDPRDPPTLLSEQLAQPRR